jgi:alpha-glucoside transport system substrate-binding protein
MRFLVGVCVAALAVTACASDDATQPDEGASLRVFGNYRDGDAEAFRLVLDRFTQQTGIETTYVGTAAFAQRIVERVRDGDPPDVALFPQPAILAEMARSGHLVPLGSELEEALVRRYSEWALSLGSVEEAVFGVPYRVSVKSLVWYRPGVFAAQGYAIPETWDELTNLTAQMVADGFTPWCLGMEAFGATGWVGTDWIEDIVLRGSGPELYDRWAAGAVPFDDVRIRGAFEEFGSIALTPGLVAGGRRAILTVPALDAIQPMFDTQPGCLMTRQGSFQEGALPEGIEVGPEEDVYVFVLPPMDPGSAPVLVSGEIAAAFSDSEEARALMAFLATPQAGAPWAERGGYTSPLVDFDLSLYGTEFERDLGEFVRQAEVVRFDGSDLMPPAVGTGTFWQGMVGYVAGEPLASVLDSIQAGYDASEP